MAGTHHCATPRCPHPAVVVFTARQQVGEIRYRSAASCPTHRREHRAWVAATGPTVHETPLTTAPEDAGLLW